MTRALRVVRGVLPFEHIAPLAIEAEGEGHGFVRRLLDDWRIGSNRFDAPGEALFIDVEKDNVLGTCGLNVDPYLNDPRVGRIRHLYVRRDSRRQGVATRLLAATLRAAAGRFDRLRLRTENPVAGSFYERRGFEPVCGDSTATHWIIATHATPSTRLTEHSEGTD